MNHLSREMFDLFDLECKTNDWKRILYDAQIDEAECFDPGGDNDEIDAFLAIEVPTYIEEGYYDSEGDVLYLESLLSDDTTHNISPEVFFDHEPQHDTFSPKSDPLHHEFTGELITIPPGIVREHEDYINRMSLLCGNSSSQSPENSHTIIESLPTSTTLIEDSDSNREEIDIFSGPDDSIPPGIESDFDSEEDIIDNLLNDDPIPEYERLTFDMEPNVLVINNVNEDECFDPGGAARLGCAETKVATWDDLAFKLIILGWNVRIKQKSQENGQNWVNTDTGTEEHTKSQENAIKDYWNLCADKLNLGKSFMGPTSLSLDKLELVDSSLEPFIAFV
ncbi:hypothetical protein Tco_1107634 [Tanacetum coccineum]